ncbi:hypothetical protein [Streptomyces sp. McG8]|uniref:hypothetical protein n=1 Tax=Streptomyces sp. McG8 TaxID=2725487 RepID=UPI001BE78C52|nr:hypothetical protein [Streptomyces sp. McG8]WSB46723.1 hypothetical protein OHA00_04990 [Streptomyces cellulosae]
MDNCQQAVYNGGLGAAFLNSMIVMAGAVLLTVVVASLAAFFCACTPGRIGQIGRAVFGVLAAGLAVPA